MDMNNRRRTESLSQDRKEVGTTRLAIGTGYPGGSTQGTALLCMFNGFTRLMYIALIAVEDRVTDISTRCQSGSRIKSHLLKMASLPETKKYAAFSKQDSRTIELAYQQLADEEDSKHRRKLGTKDEIESGDLSGAGKKKGREEPPNKGSKNKVPVNEDFLFDVDVEVRELRPAYWLGPVYEVRRGTWFYPGTTILLPYESRAEYLI